MTAVRKSSGDSGQSLAFTKFLFLFTFPFIHQ